MHLKMLMNETKDHMAQCCLWFVIFLVRIYLPKSHVFFVRHGLKEMPLALIFKLLTDLFCWRGHNIWNMSGRKALTGLNQSKFVHVVWKSKGYGPACPLKAWAARWRQVLRPVCLDWSSLSVVKCGNSYIFQCGLFAFYLSAFSRWLILYFVISNKESPFWMHLYWFYSDCNS